MTYFSDSLHQTNKTHKYENQWKQKREAWIQDTIIIFFSIDCINTLPTLRIFQTWYIFEESRHETSV